MISQVANSSGMVATQITVVVPLHILIAWIPETPANLVVTQKNEAYSEVG